MLAPLKDQVEPASHREDMRQPLQPPLTGFCRVNKLSGDVPKDEPGEPEEPIELQQIHARMLSIRIAASSECPGETSELQVALANGLCHGLRREAVRGLVRFGGPGSPFAPLRRPG